jgi:membrane protease YdiL (CAAX protease family)
VRLDPALAHTLPAIVLAIVVAIVYPLLGLRRFRRLEHLPDPLPSRTRLRLYWNLLASQWTLVACTALLLGWGGRSLRDLGQSFGPNPGVTVAVASSLLLLFALLSWFTTRQLKKATSTDLPRRMRKAGKILPQTDRERGWFVLVALTAGVCEEILYRGFLPWFIDGWTGVVGPGYVLAALAFGLGHAYQGREGIVVTAILGLFFGSLAFGVRSLVPGQVLHVAIDLVNGIAVGAALVRARAAAGAGVVDAPEAPPA